MRAVVLTDTGIHIDTERPDPRRLGGEVVIRVPSSATT